MLPAPEALARRARLPRNRVPARRVRELRCPGRRAAPPARPAPQARPEWTTPERPGLPERGLLPLRLRRTPGRTAQPAIPRLRVASPAAARPAPTRVDRRPACLRVAARGHAVRASFTPTHRRVHRGVDVAFGNRSRSFVEVIPLHLPRHEPLEQSRQTAVLWRNRALRFSSLALPEEFRVELVGTPGTAQRAGNDQGAVPSDRGNRSEIGHPHAAAGLARRRDHLDGIRTALPTGAPGRVSLARADRIERVQGSLPQPVRQRSRHGTAIFDAERPRRTGKAHRKAAVEEELGDRETLARR